MTVDDSTTSRFTDRIYVSWTAFAADGTAYIYEAWSNDYGETFSAPVLVSRDSARCPNTFGLPTPNGRCNENQFSEPFTAPDGTLYVVYANVNNNTSEPAPPGGDGADKHLANPNDNFNQILISRSTNGGQSFGGTGMDPRQMPIVTTRAKQGTTDQWWQAEAFSKTGTLAVSYFDRGYGTDESTGYSDFTLSVSTDAGISFANTRASSGSMPPPTEFVGTFYGDYTGIALAGNTAYPVWPDTRRTDLFLCPGTGTPGYPPLVCTMSAPNAPLANDEEISTVALTIP